MSHYVSDDHSPTRRVRSKSGVRRDSDLSSSITQPGLGSALDENEVDELQTERQRSDFTDIQNLDAAWKERVESLEISHAQRLNESGERHEALLSQCSSLQTRLDLAEENERAIRQQYQDLLTEHHQCRSLRAKLEARIDDLQLDEKDKRKTYEAEIEKFEENMRLMKKEIVEDYKVRDLVAMGDIDLLTQRLGDRDEELRLANTRIAEKNRTITSLKDYLRKLGYTVSTTEDLPDSDKKTRDTIAITATIATPRLRFAESAKETEEKGVIESELKQRIDTYESVLQETIEVMASVRMGSFDKKIVIHSVDMSDARVVDFKHAINSMVETVQLHTSEISRVADELGAEGILGCVAVVHNSAGAWKDLVENVNHLAMAYTSSIRSTSAIASKVLDGDLASIPIPYTKTQHGEVLHLYRSLYDMLLELRLVTETISIVSEDATNGRFPTDGRFRVITNYRSGSWQTLADDVENIANSYMHLVRYVTDVANAVVKDGTSSLQLATEGPAHGEVEIMQNAVDLMFKKLNASELQTSEPGGAKQTDEQRKRLDEIWKVLHSTL